MPAIDARFGKCLRIPGADRAIGAARGDQIARAGESNGLHGILVAVEDVHGKDGRSGIEQRELPVVAGRENALGRAGERYGPDVGVIALEGGDAQAVFEIPKRDAPFLVPGHGARGSDGEGCRLAGVEVDGSQQLSPAVLPDLKRGILAGRDDEAPVG